MKVAFFTEGGYNGKIPRNTPMRTDQAWVCALNATHHCVFQLNEVNQALLDEIDGLFERVTDQEQIILELENKLLAAGIDLSIPSNTTPTTSSGGDATGGEGLGAVGSS